MDALIDIDIELLELGLAPEPELAPDATEYLVANNQEITPSPFQPIADMLPMISGTDETSLTSAI